MIELKSTPGNYYSAQGDLLFIVNEPVKAIDPITYPDYKYIADIYVSGSLVTRLKRVPQPDTKLGIFNIRDIVRNYLLTKFSPVALTIQAQQLGLGQFFIDVQVKFGEEYGGTLYTNVLIDSLRNFYNHYNGRMLGVNTILPNVLNRAATSRAYESGVGSNSNASFIPYLPLTADPFNVIITKYGSTPSAPNTTIQWGYFPTDPTSGVDGRTLQFSQSFAYGANNVNLNFTILGDNQYLVIKEDVSQPVKTSWFNTTFNYGTIPDQVFKDALVIGSFRYYISRIKVVLDSGNYAIGFMGAGVSPPTPIVTSSTTAVITPTQPVVSGPNSTLVLSEQTTPDFIDADGELTINGVVYQSIFSSGTITVNMTVGASYSFKAYVQNPNTATNPKYRLTIKKGGVVIFDKQDVAAVPNILIKAGVVKNAVYEFKITTISTTTPVTMIDIDDTDPVPFTIPLQILNVSPGAINNLTPGFIDASVEYYTVQLGLNSIYRYDVICEPRYRKYNIHFLNKYGGIDTKLFSKVSRKTIAVSKQGYGKLPYTIDGNGIPMYYNANNVYNDIAPIYSSQYTEQLVLNSDFVNDAEYSWLQDLLVSTLVYIELNGYYIPVDILERSYEVKKAINDKLTNLIITIQYGDKFSAQQR